MSRDSSRVPAVSWPAAPIARNWPMPTPSCWARWFASVGMFSRIERNSSPWSTPLASAWPSWSVPALISSVAAPETMPACWMVFTSASTWLLVAPMFLAAIEKRTKAPALSLTATPVC